MAFSPSLAEGIDTLVEPRVMSVRDGACSIRDLAAPDIEPPATPFCFRPISQRR